MGLGMFAYKTRAVIADVDFDYPQDVAEICYWRNHPNLHAWMEELYRSKGGSGSFNCMPVKLGVEDLQMLEATINHNALPVPSRSFFGESLPEEKSGDLAFIRDALAAIEAGYSVFYTSWW